MAESKTGSRGVERKGGSLCPAEGKSKMYKKQKVKSYWFNLGRRVKAPKQLSNFSTYKVRELEIQRSL